MEVLPKRTPICDWHDGMAVDEIVLLREVQLRETRAGSPFLKLRVADRTATAPAVIWDGAGELAPIAQPGAVLRVAGRFEEHSRYGAQLTVRCLAVASTDEIDWAELLAAPVRPVSELTDELDALLESIADPHLRVLARGILGADCESGRAYRVVPAAKFNHHAYRSGLLEHSLQVAAMVDAASATYDGVDRDLAVCGALLHDIGKLEAYDVWVGGSDISDAGRLEGEIPLGYFRVRRAIEEQAGFPPELAQNLLHIILAHHGRLEFGSPVVPATREATLVHFMDNLSGQMGALDRQDGASARPVTPAA